MRQNQWGFGIVHTAMVEQQQIDVDEAVGKLQVMAFGKPSQLLFYGLRAEKQFVGRI